MIIMDKVAGREYAYLIHFIHRNLTLKIILFLIEFFFFIKIDNLKVRYL